MYEIQKSLNYLKCIECGYYFNPSDVTSKPVVVVSDGAPEKPKLKTYIRPKFRRFEYRGYTDKGNESNKFWEVTVVQNRVITKWGKIGTFGSSKENSYTSKEEAEKKVKSLVRSKIRKGYVEVE